MADYGLDIYVPFTGDPDPTLPWADDDDALLVPGSLLLLDPAHSVNPLVGVPALNDRIANIAWKRAAALLGSGDATTLGFKRSGIADTANKLMTERTPKGGLHSVISQTNMSTSAAEAFTVNMDTTSPLVPYLLANKDHAFYYSSWDRVTRAASDAAGGDPGEMFIGTSTGAYIIGRYRQRVSSALQTLPAIGSLGTKGVVDPVTSVSAAGGNRFLAMGVASGRGSTQTANPLVNFHVVGTQSPWGGSQANLSASRIMYRSYLEDLTVSGRTYEQVQALDYALWQAAFATGGRFNGDSFTAPPFA